MSRLTPLHNRDLRPGALGTFRMHTEDVAEILVFHHAQGLTEGLGALADRVRAQGHVVHTPDAYSGTTFDRLDDGLEFAQRIGHDAFEEVARRAARAHCSADVTIGFSLGCFPAQLLAQELRRVRACALIGGAIAPAQLGGDWSPDVALQVHVAEPDEWVAEEALRELLSHTSRVESYRYRDKRHLFADSSHGDYDADAAGALEERLLAWLEQF